MENQAEEKLKVFEQMLEEQEKTRGIKIAIEAEKRMGEIVKGYKIINANTLIYTLEHINMTLLNLLKDMWGAESAKEIRENVKKDIDEYIKENWKDGGE